MGNRSMPMPPGAAPAPVEQQQQTKAAEEAAEVVEKSTADVVKSPVSDLVPKSDNLPSAAAKDSCPAKKAKHLDHSPHFPDKVLKMTIKTSCRINIRFYRNECRFERNSPFTITLKAIFE